MLKLVIEELEFLNEIKNSSNVYTSLDQFLISREDKNILNSIVDVLSSQFFATTFVSDSYCNSFASVYLKNEKESLCRFFHSVMIDSNVNFLIGTVENIVFIICQHVTSCDFVYFPEFKYYHSVAHSALDGGVKVLKNLYKSLMNNYNESYATEKKLKGLIMSHGRPYHFFYDTALAVEDLYRKNLLDKFEHYQINNCNFLAFNRNYELSHINNTTLKFDELNDLALQNDEIFFKVGIKYGAGSSILTELALNFDNRLLKNSESILNDPLSPAIKISNLKRDGYFVLWFGVCSEKRQLTNQIEILKVVINKLSIYYNICIVIDGITRSNYQYDIEAITPMMVSDNKFLEIIEKTFADSEIISLIGATSLQKVSVASLVDFHITTGSTGSIWPSRIAKKLGVMHISQAFYKLTQLMHLHYNSLDFPNNLVVDNIEKVKRVDFVSYKIDKDDFLNFINTNYPNIFNADYKLDRFKILSNTNIDCIDKQKNTYSSLNNDPQVYLNVDSLVNLEYSYTLNIVAYISYDSNIGNKALAFYLNYGDGFNSNDVVSLSTESFSDRAEVNILIEKPLIGIRFDPINAEVDFQLKGLFYKIKKVL